MDICFKAFQHKTTGTMVEDVTQTPTTRTRPAVSVLPGWPTEYGDFTLMPWAWFAIASATPPVVTAGDVDVAA